MDVARGIGAPFRDPQWIVKSLLGGVWAIVPFTGFALTGYYLDYIRNTAHGRETPLPEWSLFGRYWLRGLLASVAMFIYLLPALLLLLGFAFIALFPVAGSLSYQSDIGYYPGPNALFAGGLCAAIGLAVIYTIASWVIIAAALAHYAMYEEFGTLFALGEIRRRMTTPGASYATALLMSVAITVAVSIAASVIGALLAIVPFAGLLVGSFASAVVGFLGSLIAAHLFGQYAARAYGLPGVEPIPAYGHVPPVAPPPAPDQAVTEATAEGVDNDRTETPGADQRQ